MKGKYAKDLRISKKLIAFVTAGVVLVVAHGYNKFKQIEQDEIAQAEASYQELVEEEMDKVSQTIGTGNDENDLAPEETTESLDEKEQELPPVEAIADPTEESPYTHVEETSTTENYKDLTMEVKKAVQATTTVNIRSLPSTDGTILGTLSPNKKLDLIYQENEDWYKVKYNESEAYVSAKYSNIVEDKQIKDEVQSVVCVIKDSTMYDDKEQTLPIMSIPKYEAALIYKDLGDRYVASIEDNIGYIKKEDTKVLDGTFVIVDISDQTAYLYEDNKLVSSTPVVTGKNSTPTTKGLHEVWLMQRDRYLTGADFNVHVNTVAFFHNGEGLHDATWRGSFGGTQYKNNGSHGCVNMPSKAAETFYSNLEVGDEVLVKQ